MNPHPHTVVLGMGASGEAAALLLRREGRPVTVLDTGASDVLRARANALEREGIRVCLGTDAVWPADVRACVASPGVPLTSPWFASARAAGVPWVSELELGWSRLGVRTMAVTGSNGKSTLVKWLAEAIGAAGLRAWPAGNYGTPVSRLALDAARPDWLVLEVSSFQLETVDAFRPDIGILLNLLPNHLDRHGSMAVYRAAKSRLFARMSRKDTAIVPARLRAGMARRVRCGASWVSFGTGPASTYRWADGRVRRGRTMVADLAGTWFDNPVLGPAAAAAAAAIEASGLSGDCLADAARRFQPLPHRMQPVGEAGGVVFIDDSKATSLAALAAGLRQVQRPVRLVAGGLAKGDRPEDLKEMLAERCRGVYLIGRDADLFFDAWSGTVPCERCGNLDRAFKRAASDAEPGEAVLLSPGCASFDQFGSFEERGNIFAALVRTWIESA